jgi:hypothetical protein
MRLQNLLDHYPSIHVADPARQLAIFSIIEQTSLSSEALQVSFERKPDFYHFLKAQGDSAYVFLFTNKNGTPNGLAASSFRRMKWNGHPVTVGYTSDLRTTTKLDRDGRIQWRKFYAQAVDSVQQIEEFDGAVGFVTAVWNENILAQQSLVKKRRPGDFTYELANRYRSYSVWGRWKKSIKPPEVVRPIQSAEIPSLIQKLCGESGLSWTEYDLSRTLAVFQKSFKDFYVLEKSGKAQAYVLPTSTSDVKKTIIKRWPFYLSFMAKLLPLMGKRKISLCEPLEILQLMLFRSLTGDELENLNHFIDYFWFENSKLPRKDQFSILSVNIWEKPGTPEPELKKRGYFFTAIDGALYKVVSDNTSPTFQEMKDFSHLEIGFL